MSHDLSLKRPLIGPVLVTGFSASIGLWVVWFVTHLPWMNDHVPERFAVPALLVCWLASFVAAGANLGRSRGWKVGLGGGVASALPGLMLLGTKLRDQMPAGGAPDPDLVPSAGLMIAGFLATGAIIGALGGAIGGLLKKDPAGEEPDWLARFAWVTCASAAPLVFVGGLVTSTDSGMAVPDWPNTFGTNMFLYPLGPRVPAGIYLEHSHRLFGAMLGATMIVLALWTWLSSPRPFVKWWAVGVLMFIILQGVLGGDRVLRNSRMVAVFHGVSAQVIVAALVALGCYLSPLYRGLSEISPALKSKRVRVFATAATHILLVQLVFGALYRHLRHGHVLWSHAGFAMFVLVASLIAGFAAAGLAGQEDRPARPVRAIRNAGKLMVGVVCLQFAIGWVTFLMGGKGAKAEAIPEALVRTTHQANGALLLGLTAFVFIMARQASRIERARAEQA